MKLIEYRICAALTLCLAMAAPAPADTVSATPGYFTGTIVYNGPTQPDSVTIDARDVTNTFTAHADATQDKPSCVAGSNTWCYKITVESGLAGSYWLRPIAWINKSVPLFVSSRIPFPVQPPAGFASGATVALLPIVYTPGRVYLIVGAATGQANVTGYGCAAVVVPHDQSASSVAGVNAMASAAVNACKSGGQAPAGYVRVGAGPVISPKQ